ncbi:PRC-barrel domain-containing protein [Mucilaginibacter sp.]
MSSNENITDTNRLVELGGSDYEIADGQPNIKGWDVYDVNHKKIGAVDELLFNPASRRVRYLVVDLKQNNFNLAARKIAVPIGVAELHEHNDEVLLPEVTAIHLTSLPTYEKGKPFTQDRELAIRNAFIVPQPAVIQGADFYEHDHFDQNKFYGRRYQPQPGSPTPGHQLPDANSTRTGEDTTNQNYNRDDLIP